jgi:hypothetical protein
VDFYRARAQGPKRASERDVCGRRRDFRVSVVDWGCAEMGIEVLIGVVIGAVYVEDSEVWLFGGAGCMWRAKMRSLYVRMFGGWVRAGCLSVCLT